MKKNASSMVIIIKKAPFFPLATFFLFAIVFTFFGATCFLAAAAKENIVPSPTTVRGASMVPLLKNGDVVSVLPFDCRKNPSAPLPVRGDIVVFNSGAYPAMPLIKRVAAVAGDTLDLRSDGTIIVNGKPAPNPAGEPYVAVQRERGMFALYKGKIPNDAYLVLGNSGSFDSGRFGLISCEEMTGIVDGKNHALNVRR